MLTAGLDAASGLGAAIRGRLRINAPRAALPLLAQRLLPEFLDLHPDVELELVGEDRVIDIVALGFDAGIRFGRLAEADMVATRLTAPDRYVVVATPAFVQEQGRPSHPEDLRAFRCIGYLRDSTVEPWRFRVGREPLSVRVKGGLTTNDVHACLRAALCGAGYFCLARSLVLERLARGELVTVLDDYAPTIPGLSLYYPSRSRSLPKLRAFVQLAKKRMRPAGE
jgi:DNA-binding transcriptional LysR family regulator